MRLSVCIESVVTEGRTGVPFVDANMREMTMTGFMSNRGRQNVASFLTKDLGLDWRMGAEWFEHLLVGVVAEVESQPELQGWAQLLICRTILNILVCLNSYFPLKVDHDVCSNYGNWLYSAGIGNDPRENRKFNMIKQGLDYDNNVCLWRKLSVYFAFNRAIKMSHLVGEAVTVPRRWEPSTMRKNVVMWFLFLLLNDLSVCSRATIYVSGFLSYGKSGEVMRTHPGPSVLLCCHMLRWPLVRRTPRRSSWRLNGADMLTRNRWVFAEKGID